MVFPEKIKLADSEFELVSRTVYEHCGINLKADKRELVQSRLAKLVRRNGYSSYGAYLEHALSDPSSGDFVHFIDVLSTNLTSFFRENQHFEYLVDTFLPGLMANVSRSSRLRIRGWSAGCSSGEEPYSIAMTLAEHIPERDLSNVKILASDISSRMISRAREGDYAEGRMGGVSPGMRQRHFTKCTEADGKHYRVRDELRRMLIFKQINLMGAWPIDTGIDFIFCRNVMIYFDKPTQEKLVNRYYDVLNRGGMLFIGHSESLSGVHHRFKYIAPTIYQKK